MWRPNIAYTEMNRVKNISEVMYLYPNGTVQYYRELELTLTCVFQYENIPSDEHECQVTAYIINEFSDTAMLKLIDKF